MDNPAIDQDTTPSMIIEGVQVDSQVIKNLKKEVRKSRKALQRDPSNISVQSFHEGSLACLKYAERSKEKCRVTEGWRNAFLARSRGDMKKYWDHLKCSVPSNNQVSLSEVVPRSEVESFFRSVYFNESFPPLKSCFPNLYILICHRLSRCLFRKLKMHSSNVMLQVARELTGFRCLCIEF